MFADDDDWEADVQTPVKQVSKSDIK